MSPADFIPIVCALVSCSCAVWVAVRSSRWRETDEAKAVLKRIADVEASAASLGEKQSGLATKTDLVALQGKVGGLATQTDLASLRAEVGGLATQADLARVEGEVHVVAQVARGVAAGVDRIETFWMEERRGNR